MSFVDFGSKILLPDPKTSCPRSTDVLPASSAEDILSTDGPKHMLATASGVGETQSREAVSKWPRMSATWGLLLGSRFQHRSVSAQTSSDNPRMSRLMGREGRSPARISTGIAPLETWENGCWREKTFRNDSLGASHYGT
jgi:hypothetical protein